MLCKALYFQNVMCVGYWLRSTLVIIFCLNGFFFCFCLDHHDMLLVFIYVFPIELCLPFAITYKFILLERRGGGGVSGWYCLKKFRFATKLSTLAKQIISKYNVPHL